MCNEVQRVIEIKIFQTIQCIKGDLVLNYLVRMLVYSKVVYSPILSCIVVLALRSRLFFHMDRQTGGMMYRRIIEESFTDSPV